jgi:hypothetical protein
VAAVTHLDEFTFLQVVHRLCELGFRGDIDWSENAAPPATPEDFAEEAIFVICNGGMKNTVARKIYDRVMPQVRAGKPVAEVFGHRLKCRAIEKIWAERSIAFFTYDLIETDEERIEFLGRLPHIGKITKFHLAKNFGVNVAKPDVHLQRLADHHRETVQGLCERLAEASRYKARTVDVLLWRACAEGVIDSRSGEVRLP